MEFFKGVDISSLLELENNGLRLYTKEGKACEALELCRKNGINSIRIRIWNEPSRIKEAGGYCDLEHTVLIARRIKEKNFHFLLDFHYSDFWADPGKQEKPEAWKRLDKDELVQAVYDYTREVLVRLKEEHCMPDMVQIGNEIRSGMLFPDGEVPNYEQLAKLVNAGIQAVRDTDADIKVMIHLDQGGKFYYLKNWFDAMFAAGMHPFDIIGVSYYPFWHGTFTDLKNSLESLVDRYSLPVMVVETAHPWRRCQDGFVTEEQEKIAGFQAGIEEQCTVMKLLMNIVASVKNQMGLGVYYWEPLVLPMEGQGSWANNMGMLDLNGRELPAFEEFRFTRDQVCPHDMVKIYHPEPIVTERGKTLELPQTVEVLRYDGCRDRYPVAWERFQPENCGVYELKGFIDAIARQTQLKISVVDRLPEHTNLIKNADFSQGEANWMLIKKQDNIQVEINHQEGYLQVSSDQNFVFYICQDVQICHKGIYAFRVMYRGTNTTGVRVRMYGEQVSGDSIVKEEKIIYPTDDKWMQYDIEGIALTEGTFTVGLEMNTPPVMGKIKGFQLYRIG